MLLTTWSEAAADGKNALPVQKLTSKERMLQKAEAALNERLASAAASLQSFKMATLEVHDAPAGSNAGLVARSPPKRHTTSSPHPKRVETAGEGATGEDKLRLDGRQVPSSNERLGLILADLMR